MKDSGEWLRVKDHGIFAAPLVRAPQKFSQFEIDLAKMQKTG